MVLMPESWHISPTATLTLFVIPFTYLFVLLCKYIHFQVKQYRALSQFPGPEMHWLWGNMFTLQRDLGEKMLQQAVDLTTKYKYCYRVYVNPIHGMLVCVHPDAMKPILKKADGKSFIYETIKPWLGEGLLIAKGAKWTRNRRLLTPAFHFDVLKPYMKVYNDATQVLLDKMATMAEADQPFEIFNHISLLTLDIILQCAFSYNTDCQTRGQRHPYIKAVYELATLWQESLKSPYNLLVRWAYKYTKKGRQFYQLCDLVHGEAQKVIDKRKKELEHGIDAKLLKKKRHLDFLDILLTAKDTEGNPMSDEDIRAEVDTFMFEGHDTTASGISWTLYALAKHQQYQQQVQEEVDELVREKGSDFIEWEDLPKLNTLTMCLKETMRLYSPVPIIARKLEKDIQVMDKTMPAGTIVQLPIWNLHHNPEVWEQPMEYKPERFLPENMKGMDPFAYIPFSAGPRNCIGQNFALNEEKVVLARLLHRYKIEISTDCPDVNPVVMLVLRSKQELRLKLTPRQPTV